MHLVAVAHTLLVIIYHIIKYRVDYQDLALITSSAWSRSARALPGQASGATGLRGDSLEKHAT